MNKKYISDIEVLRLKALYDNYKDSNAYIYRNEQKSFCKVAKEVLCYMVTHDKFTPDSITMLVHLLTVNPTMNYIESELKKITDSDDDFNRLCKLFEECKYRGFTAVGRGKIFITEQNAKEVGIFIADIIQCTTKEDVAKAIIKYEDKNIPFCTTGIYSPWIHYIHPKLCPIANGQNDKFLEYLDISKKKKSDYLFMMDLFEEVMEVTGAEDYSMLDNFLYAVDFKRNDTFETPNIWLWGIECPDYLYCGSGWREKGGEVQKQDVGIYKTKEEFDSAFKSQTQKRCGRLSNSYWMMSHETKAGDIVVAFHGKHENDGTQYIEAYAWGVLSSGYQYKDNLEMESFITCNVEWKHIGSEFTKVYNSDFYFQKLTDSKRINQIIHFFDIPIYNTDNIRTNMKYQEYINLLKENHNLILTGAPGTGKTYMAKAIAEEMGAVTEFVQFHPSYDYTDFVEGLRPIEKGEDQVGFRRMDGIFKQFCKKAILDDATEDDDILKKLNNDPKVWKVSLEKTYDNPTRTDCLENGYIRIGWSEYGDVEDFNDMQDFPDGGRVILRAFQSEMQVGDIVVSCYSQSETDAIGIVTGDYEYRAEGGNLPRYRTVEWLVKGVKINIQEVIGKKMTLSTVYKLNISVPKVLEIVKNNGGLEGKLVNKEKPYVMIIDEINRGELSKIFGELFYAIDPGYRGTKGKVKTQYQNLIDESDVFADGFYIPENVYILATMNDIDRSVESMDFAMRRRFTWKEVTPDKTVDNIFEGELDSALAASAKDTMTRLNNKIAEADGLGEAFMIGPSYFLKLKKYNGDFEKLWEMNIEPLLKEYLRGFRKANDTLEGFRKVYFNKVNKEEQTSEENSNIVEEKE